MMPPVDIVQGDSPLVLGLPHTGTFVPKEIHACLNENGRTLADTDWHIDRLYDGLVDGVSSVRANFHRYVIDANRDPSGVSLYPEQATTGLVPVTDFDGRDIWDTQPTSDEIEARRLRFHAPYHQTLENELQRVKDIHGFAILYDCHSIRSDIPYLFEGILPDFNIGTNLGTTCAARIEAETKAHCEAAIGYSAVLNGRFVGGWTTRHYGRPKDGFHAIQMELAQSTYLTNEAAPWAYDTAKATQLRRTLRDILTSIRDWHPQQDTHA